MIYSKFNERRTIGVFAPSSGLGDRIEKLNTTLDFFENLGYNVKITDSTFNDSVVSGTPEIRVKEFEELLLDDDIDIIFCACGGEFAIEIASLLNFDLVKDYPKYIVGFSDSTLLTYLVTTNSDVASITSYNFINVYRVIKDKSLDDLLKVLDGKLITQEMFNMYEKEKIEDKMMVDTKNEYFSNRRNINISGRIIGGTIEVLSEIIGMPYDKTNTFLNKYKSDGIIWYFDICEMNSNDFYRALVRMNQLNYFDDVKLVLISKMSKWCEEKDITFEESLTKVFGDIPIIRNVDIGHLYPKITIVNGSIANVVFKNGKFLISFTYE